MKDVVSGMNVEGKAKFKADQGGTYYFCSADCLKKLQDDPKYR